MKLPENFVWHQKHQLKLSKQTTSLNIYMYITGLSIKSILLCQISVLQILVYVFWLASLTCNCKCMYMYSDLPITRMYISSMAYYICCTFAGICSMWCFFFGCLFLLCIVYNGQSFCWFVQWRYVLFIWFLFFLCPHILIYCIYHFWWINLRAQHSTAKLILIWFWMNDQPQKCDKCTSQKLDQNMWLKLNKMLIIDDWHRTKQHLLSLPDRSKH